MRRQKKLIVLGAPEAPLELIGKFFARKNCSENPINQKNWGSNKMNGDSDH